MPSASERIRQELAKQAAERAAREAAERKSEADRRVSEQRAKQQAQDEHKRKLQHSREVADRVLRESGVLAEVQAIKRDHIDGKFPKSALFESYFGSDNKTTGVILTLAWGKAFKIKKTHDFTQIDYETGLFGTYPHIKDYNYINVIIQLQPQSIEVNGSRIRKDGLQEALARAFVNPLHEHVVQHGDRGGGGLSWPPVQSGAGSPGG